MKLERQYAGFWIRTLAYLIDQALLTVVTQILTYSSLFLLYLVAKAVQSPPPESFGAAFSGTMIQMTNLLASFVISLPYYIAFHHYRGATLGKQILGIRVVDEATGEFPSIGQSTGRFFASILSWLLVGAGVLMVAFNREKRALHDVLAGTVSILAREPFERESEPAPSKPQSEPEGPSL